MIRRPPTSPLFPSATLSRSAPPPTADGRRPSGGKPIGLDGGCRREAQATERQNTEEQRDDHGGIVRSEEHTSGLPSPCNIVCRLLLGKKTTSLLQSARL